MSIIPTAGDSITYWFLDDMLRVPNNCDPNGSNKDSTTKSPSITAAKLFDPITFPPSYVLTSVCTWNLSSHQSCIHPTKCLTKVN